MTAYSEGVDDLSQVDRKTSTTVAMDFGRITIDSEIILYLFGTPGQERFWFMWDDLVDGAIGAVVLLDTRRIEQCFAAVDYFESRGVPFVAVVNQFPDAGSYSLEEVREALALPAHVPLVRADARSRESVKMVLVALLDHLIQRATAGIETSAIGGLSPGLSPTRRCPRSSWCSASRCCSMTSRCPSSSRCSSPAPWATTCSRCRCSAWSSTRSCSRTTGCRSCRSPSP